MKQRRISLLNYTIFLFFMGIIWFVTMQKDHIDELSQSSDMVELLETLTKQITNKVDFYVDASFSDGFKE